MKALVLTLAVTLTLAGCGKSSSPASPSPNTPPAAASGEWFVTQSFVSVTGPDNCWVAEQRQRWTGAVFVDLPMTVTRSGNAITLKSDFFQVNYAGSINGSEFSATGSAPLEGGGRPCLDGTSFQQRPGVSNLTGRFSAGDQILTASEVNSYVLTSGEPVAYTWGWQATRRN